LVVVFVLVLVRGGFAGDGAPHVAGGGGDTHELIVGRQWSVCNCMNGTRIVGGCVGWFGWSRVEGKQALCNGLGCSVCEMKVLLAKTLDKILSFRCTCILSMFTLCAVRCAVRCRR
jgi:hypothetical protein